ncbi:hypothetical protein ACJJTC_016505 [Scirpophaga incertulas]
MAHADALSRNPVAEAISEDHILDVLSTESEDWIATVQSADEEISHIKQILSDPNSERIAEIIKNYKIKNDETVNVESREDITEIRREAGVRIANQQIKDKQRYDKKRDASVIFSAGDLVSIKRETPSDGKSKKLVVKYQGPYRIIKALPNDRYLIEDTPISRKNGRRYENIIAIDKMKPWLAFDKDFVSSGSDQDENAQDEL